MKEKLYSLIGLGFLTVGFIVGVAGADKDGPKDLAHATDQLIQHVALANEANRVNQNKTIIGPTGDENRPVVTVVHSSTENSPPKTDQKTQEKPPQKPKN